MAGQVDMYLWDGDNITTLCSDDCEYQSRVLWMVRVTDILSGISSTTSWIQGVYDNCDPTDTIYVDTKLVPIDTVATRYTDGLGLACLNDQYVHQVIS